MLLAWGQCCISITDEIMSDLSDNWTHMVCYRQFCRTHLYYCRQVQPQCMRGCERVRVRARVCLSACVRARVHACVACVRCLRACVRA